MYYVYVLRSQKNGKRYVGYTAKEIEVRLKEHNYGSNQWAKQNGPFELAYADEFSNKKEAIDWEKFLKSGQGRQCLDELSI
jgi:putative endonuclease